MLFVFSSFIAFANEKKLNNHGSHYGFIENKGQTIDQYGNQNLLVKYTLNIDGVNIFLKHN